MYGEQLRSPAKSRLAFQSRGAASRSTRSSASATRGPVYSTSYASANRNRARVPGPSRERR